MKTKGEVEVPATLAAVLKKDPAARKIFERMSPSCQREYVKWVAEAKKLETQAQRAAKVLEQIAAWGKQHPASLRRSR